MIRKTLDWALGVIWTIGELFGSAMTKRSRRFVVLIPVLLIFAAMIALITSSGVLAPFIYPLF